MIEAPAVHSTTGVAPWQAEPYRLWSLLDMQQFYGIRFLHSLGKFSRIMGTLLERSFPTKDEATQQTRDWLRTSLRELAASMHDVPLSYVIQENLKRLLDRIKEDSLLELTDRELLLLASDFHNNLLNDLGSHLFLFVPAARKNMFMEPEKWFGEAVKSQFGVEAGPDIVHTAKCLALAQWTAAVFHSMRIMEYGLRALAMRVSVSFATSFDLENWKNIIDQIEREIRKQEALPKSPAKSKELQFCAEAATHFWYVKEAWRNHVSHSRSVYGEPDATKIVEHVRDFMAALST